VFLAMLFITRKDLLEEAKIHKNNHCISKLGVKKIFNLKHKDFTKTIFMVVIRIGQLFLFLSSSAKYCSMILSRGVRWMRTLISATKPWQVP
jgi:hypothetical protein